jgi:hypothetical protein
MNRLFLALGALALCVVGHTATVNAQSSNPSLLIMAEDGDGESIPRTSRISTRILNELVTQLDTRGFDVYDEAAVTLRTHTQGRSRRSDAELVDVAKSIRRPPIDVVIFFEVFANVTRKAYQNELRLRTVGRLLSVGDGRRLGNWEAKLPEGRDQVWLLPNRCFPEGQGASRECLLEVVGDDVRILAQEVGAIISEKLEANLGSASSGGQDEGLKRGFNLVFDGFSSRDYRDMEEYLTIFSGYVSHRPTRSSHLHHEVWYESTITTSRLERNMHKMMDILEIPYVLKFSGNTYTIKAKNLRQERRSSSQGEKYKW